MLADLTPAQQAAVKAGVADGIDDVRKAINGATTSVGLLGSKDEIGGNYLNRAAGVGAGIFGNSPVEAVYVGATMDKAKAGEKYVLRFPASQLPPVEKLGFWSMTMYNLPQRALIHNSLERYSIGNRSPGLKIDTDGSLTIYLQPASPGKVRRVIGCRLRRPDRFSMSFAFTCRPKQRSRATGKSPSRSWQRSSGRAGQHCS